MRNGKNLLGIGAVAVIAIFVAKSFLKPTQEKVERSAEVLSGAYEPRLVECRVLEDNELPDSVDAPPVGAAEFYFTVGVLYPDHTKVPEGSHFLAEVNGAKDAQLQPLDVESQIDDDGALVYLTFKTDGSFRYALLMRDKEVLLKRVDLD